MPISKDGNGTIVYTAPERKDLFELTGVAQSNQFAVCDKVDVLKQINLDPSAQTTNTTVTIKSASGNVSNIVLTLPNASGTLATSSGSGDSFNIIQTPSGTSPTATGQSTLTLTSSDSSVTILGNSTTDTIDFKASAGITALTGDVTATGPGSTAATVAKVNGIAVTGTPSNCQVLKASSTSAAAWADACEPSRELVFYDDWIAQSSAGQTNWFPQPTGTGAGTTLPVGDNGHVGVVQLSTGTTTTGSVYMFNTKGYASGGAVTLEFCVKIPTLSNSTDRFQTYIGLVDNAGGAPANGVYFTYSDNVNSGQWQGVTATSSTSTLVASSTAVVANTWYRLTVVISGGTATFYINGVSIGTSSTNIPSGNINLLMEIIKSAGTTAGTFQVDYFKYRSVFTTPR